MQIREYYDVSDFVSHITEDINKIPRYSHNAIFAFREDIKEIIEELDKRGFLVDEEIFFFDNDSDYDKEYMLCFDKKGIYSVEPIWSESKQTYLVDECYNAFFHSSVNSKLVKITKYVKEPSEFYFCYEDDSLIEYLDKDFDFDLSDMVVYNEDLSIRDLLYIINNKLECIQEILDDAF